MDDEQPANKPRPRQTQRVRQRENRGAVNLSWPLGETERTAFQKQGRNQILNPKCLAFRVTLEDTQTGSWCLWSCKAF